MNRLDAYQQLLALPDPAEMSRRGHGETYPGDVEHREAIKRDLARAYVARRVEDWREDSEVISVRRWPMRIVKRRAVGEVG